MNAQKQGEPVPEWNASWFGLQIGGTLWLLITALALVRRSPETAALVFGCFLVTNLFGAWLWHSRARMSIFRAGMVFSPVLGLFSILAVFVTDRAGYWTSMVLGASRNISAASMYVLIVIFVAALMILFSIKERQRKDKS